MKYKNVIKSIDMIKKKLRLLCISYFTKHLITIIMKISIKKKKIIIFINKNEINIIITTLIKKIKKI